MRKPTLLLNFLILILVLTFMPVAAQDTPGDAFPVTIEHKFGSTTITEAPQRVVAIGYTEQDPLLALGVAPVSIRYWYGDEPNAIFPWAQEEAEAINAAPEVLEMGFGTLNYEAILALEPDLISAVSAGITAEEYELLSEIAPTIAQSGDYIDFGMPWQEATQIIGDTVGKSAEAEALVAEVEDQFADARTEHPEFEGKTVAVVYSYGAGSYGFYTDQDARGRFFTDLGFVIPEAFVEMAGENFYADISAERIDLLDQDLIAILNLQFIEGSREALEADPLFSQLSAVQEGRVLYLEEQVENALGFSSVLSLPYALDAVVPQLETIFGSSEMAEPTLEATAEIAEPTEEAAVTDEAGARCIDGTIPIEHAAGESCVPIDVERVVAVEWTYAEDLLALGVQPVGVADIEGYNAWVKIPVLLDENVVDIGSRAEPNLEVIAELDPDLIITVSFRALENFDELSAIAPTLVFNPYPEDLAISQYEEMTTTFMKIARAVGREAEGEAVLAEMETTYERAQTALEEAGRGGEGFILSQGWTTDSVATFRLFTDNAMAVQILEQIGLTNAWDDAPQLYGYTEIGIEGFAELQEEEFNFFYVAQEADNNFFEESPLWNGMTFVQAEQAYWLGGDVWLFGGPLSAELLVETVLNQMGIELPAAEDVVATAEATEDVTE
jgi:iron complex transport system substrate-binding protein